MSAVKHQPATPLPWRDEGDGHLRITRPLTEEEKRRHRPKLGQRVETEQMNAIVSFKDELPYIAHAANAYPKLVAALLKANQFLHDNAPDEDETLAVTSALLNELGEMP